MTKGSAELTRIKEDELDEKTKIEFKPNPDVG